MIEPLHTSYFEILNFSLVRGGILCDFFPTIYEIQKMIPSKVWIDLPKVLIFTTHLSYFLPGHTQHYFLFCSLKVFPVRLPEAHFTPFCTLKDDVPEKNPFMGVAQITPPQARAHAILGNFFIYFGPK